MDGWLLLLLRAKNMLDKAGLLLLLLVVIVVVVVTEVDLPPTYRQRMSFICMTAVVYLL